MGTAWSQFFKKLRAFFIVLACVMLVFLSLLGWKQYRTFYTEEMNKEYVQMKTVKGDLLKGSLTAQKNGSLLLVHQGVQVYFKPNEILQTFPLEEKEKIEFVKKSARRRLKESATQLFFFFSGRVSEFDKYITPEN